MVFVLAAAGTLPSPAGVGVWLVRAMVGLAGDGDVGEGGSFETMEMTFFGCLPRRFFGVEGGWDDGIGGGGSSWTGLVDFRFDLVCLVTGGCECGSIGCGVGGVFFGLAGELLEDFFLI